jgi:8-oxo-dGTP pyrophosphatase MutT (NUDIX family)
VARIDEFFRDPHPPPVADLVVVIYAVVRDQHGQVLLVRRSDDGNWELPGGRVEVGETASLTVTREVQEESGVTIAVTGISGIYSNPDHIVVYQVEGARQQFAVCVHAIPDPPGQTPKPDNDETVDAAWFAPTATHHLAMHPDVRRRLVDGLEPAERPHID